MARQQLTDNGSVTSFEGYRATLQDYDAVTPHAQGITYEGSFKEIIEDPRTLLAVDEGIIVPGLYDIENADWFNAAYIRSKTGALEVMALHGSPNLKHMELTEEARAVGGAFLMSGGLVVVSHPEADFDAHDNANRLLSGLVSGYGKKLEYIGLGSQTYFQGEAVATDPLRWADDRERLRREFTGNEPEMIAGAFFDRPPTILRNGTNVRSYARVPEELTGEIYDFVEAAFNRIKDHPCRQAWTREEFREVVEGKPSVVKVVSEKAGSAAALLAFGARLEDFPWVNPKYWTDEERLSGKNIYFPTAACNPRAVGAAALVSSIGHMSEVFGAAGPGIRIHFDTCDGNRASLPRAIESAVARSQVHTLEFEEIAVQNYGAFRVIND